MARLAFHAFRLSVSALALILAAVIIPVLVLIPSLPDMQTIRARTLELKVPLRIYSSDGLLMGEFGNERRTPTPIDETPKEMILAILMAEDDRYFEHVGVDSRGILRALYTNLRAGARAQGGSTITMQVARNFFLSNERTYLRKAREVLLAIKLENYFSKEEILELYINKIFLGHRAYGFGAAATVYYGKSLDELELPQFAMLAALPKSPSKVNPISNPELAKIRRDYILRRMYDFNFLSDTEYAEAIEKPITAKLNISTVELKAPYVAEHIRQILYERFGQAAYEDGYSVYTTVNSENQRAAVKALREGLIQYDMRHGYRGIIHHLELSKSDTDEKHYDALKQIDVSQEIVPVLITEVNSDSVFAVTKDAISVMIPWENMTVAKRIRTAKGLKKTKEPGDFLKSGDIVYARPLDDETDTWMLMQIPEVQGALVSVDPQNGAIQAMVGGFDYYQDKFNRATQAKRQLGSNIKPFVYSAALENGFTPASMISGAPIVVENDLTGTSWKPQNYGGKFTGQIPLRTALAKSLNLISVRLARGMGINSTVNHIAKFGFDRENLPTGLSVALGTPLVTPLKVVSGYGVFANGGYKVEPYIIDLVKDRFGKAVMHGKVKEVCRSCVPGNLNAGQEQQSDSFVVKRAERVLPSANAYVMTDMLQGVIQSGTGKKARSLNRSDIGGKTGTTNDFEDAWFSGFNSAIAATVWVGFDTPRNLGNNEHGAKVALPIWIDYMKVALDGVQERANEPPDNIVKATIDLQTGKAVAADHPNAVEEIFIFGTQPQLQLAATSNEESTSTLPASNASTDELF